MDMRLTIAALVGLRTSTRAVRGCYVEPPGLEPEIAEACRAAAVPQGRRWSSFSFSNLHG
jgi:hypothetical protein